VATTDQRTHLKALLDLVCANRGTFAYLAQRPMANIGLYERDLVQAIAHHRLLDMDCSEFVKWMFKLAGLKDPTGFNMAPFGNSTSMYDTLTHFTDPMETALGTIVVFGPEGDNHAAIVYTGGIEDPILVSHGDARGPHKLALSAFATSLPAHTFLSVGLL
jgi:hypothetical protein